MPAIRFSQLSRLTLLLLASLTICYSVFAQLPPPRPNGVIVDAERNGPFANEEQRLGSIEDEMRAKRAIKYAEENYKKNLDRAREVAELAKDLNKAFQSNCVLARDDFKKLEKIERLTKQIRSNAGGSGDKVVLEDLPDSLTSALGRVEEVSDSLRRRVEKTPRQVVSASIIGKANVLLELIGLVKNMSRSGG